MAYDPNRRIITGIKKQTIEKYIDKDAKLNIDHISNVQKCQT